MFRDGSWFPSSRTKYLHSDRLVTEHCLTCLAQTHRRPDVSVDSENDLSILWRCETTPTINCSCSSFVFLAVRNSINGTLRSAVSLLTDEFVSLVFISLNKELSLQFSRTSLTKSTLILNATDENAICSLRIN